MWKVLLCFVLFVSVLAQTSNNSTNTFIIPNVPYHRQINGFTCGDASFEMIHHHFISDLDQRAIINVARTSQNEGTNTDDLIRAGHFSYLSSSATDRYFPDYYFKSGWPGAPIGMAAFGYRQDKCWVEDMLKVVAQGYPLMVLNHFALNDLEGHYRVVVGYDDENVILHDPWDRNDQPRVVKYPKQEFCDLWFLRGGVGNQTFPPFWAGFFSPWKVDVRFDAVNTTSEHPHLGDHPVLLQVTANITYPCPYPFCVDGYDKRSIAQNTTAEIYLPNFIHIDNSYVNVSNALGAASSNSSVIYLGTMKPQESRVVSWTVVVDANGAATSGGYLAPNPRINVVVGGTIRGGVIEAYCCPKDQYFPAYNYTDVIGGKGWVEY